ncbi:MAG: hypothetical protein E5X69_25610, partial [Mesorhizobium sp.]
FGHRIYRVRDPRADALKAVVRQLGSCNETSSRLAFAEKVEQAALDVLRIAKPQRSIQTNVEFYTALLLEAVGFPNEAFSNVFAAGRAAGRCRTSWPELGPRLMRGESSRMDKISSDHACVFVFLPWSVPICCTAT